MNTPTDKAIKIPLVVLALAEKVKMTPIAWNVKSDQVIIVFEQGPKICFEREEMLEVYPKTGKQEVNKAVEEFYDKYKPELIINPKPIAPAIQKLPRRKAKK
jgi:hypothetical protein